MISENFISFSRNYSPYKCAAVMTSIKLNDILQLKDISNVKVRFNIMFLGGNNPLEVFKNNDADTLLVGHYWNYNKNKVYSEGQTTIGLIKISNDQWLLFHVGKVIKDLSVFNGVGYEFENLPEYDKYLGRLVIKYKNTSQNLVRKAESVLDHCEVAQILPDIFDNDIFPGYDKVNISWNELTRVIEKDSWKTALRNQKGVYLITDVSNGKMYVGSAYGDEMILHRWTNYAKTGNGSNKRLKELEFDHIKENLRFSILDIYKSTTDIETIIERENWWKEILLTRKFGYNAN